MLDELLDDTAGGVRSGGGLGDCKFCRLSLRTSVATLTRRREGLVGVGAAVLGATPMSEARSDGRGWRCLCTARVGTEGVWSRDVDDNPALASSRVPAPWWPDMSGRRIEPSCHGAMENGRGGERAQQRQFYRVIGGLRDMGTDSFLLRDHKDGRGVSSSGPAWQLNVGRARDVDRACCGLPIRQVRLRKGRWVQKLWPLQQFAAPISFGTADARIEFLGTQHEAFEEERTEGRVKKGKG